MSEAVRTSRAPWWARWSGQSSNRRIFAAALTVGSFTFAVNLATVAKDLFVSYRFGTSDAVDAFAIAWLIVAVSIGIIAEALGVALIPGFVEARERHGAEAAGRLFSTVLVWGIVLLLVVALLLRVGLSHILPVLGGNFDAAKLRLTLQLTEVMLPCLVLNGMATLWGAALNAGNRYSSAAVAPIAVPVCAALGLVLFGRPSGIVAVAVGTTVGYLVKCIWLGVVLYQQIGFRRPWLSPRRHDVRRVFTQYAMAISASALMWSTQIVDQSMAARLPSGSVAALIYGIKVVTFPLTLGSLAIGTAVLPHFSAMASRQDWTGMRHTVLVYTRLVFVGGSLAALLLFAFSRGIVGALYERGAFTASDSAVVARVQAFSALQIPFYLVGTLLVRLAFALQRNHVLFIGTLISVPVNVVLDYVFMERMGVAGIALSTSVVYLTSAIFLSAILLPPLWRVGRPRPNG